MEDFIYTSKKAFRKYKIEMVLIGTAFIITILAIGIYWQQYTQENTIAVEAIQPTHVAQVIEPKTEKMYVYISGSVEKPDMYEITIETRLKHILEKAGGLTTEADLTYFARNINLAKRLQDQEKIHIPSILEVANGFISESDIVTDDVLTQSDSVQSEETSRKIDINTASRAELEELPSIGAVTAQKLIDNRPYTNITDLLDKKIISQNLFDKISDLIQ